MRDANVWWEGPYGSQEHGLIAVSVIARVPEK
jgi:hypothetical protein